MDNVILDDKTIRKHLISLLSRRYPQPKSIIEELRVHNGNAIADVVTIHASAHCYEIKGESDSIYRLMKQGQYYDVAFKKTTLVTTENHLDNAIKFSSKHWGIIKVTKKKDTIHFTHIRPALNSPFFNKQLAFLTLWKSELMSVAESQEINKVDKLNRNELSNLLASILTNDAASVKIGEMLVCRKLNPLISNHK